MLSFSSESGKVALRKRRVKNRKDGKKTSAKYLSVSFFSKLF